MGYYATTCSTCGSPAWFFSWGPSVECSTCRARWDFVRLLAAVTGEIPAEPTPPFERKEPTS